MTSPRPLFVTGMARSGSTLLARMLDAHEAVSCASDPLMPLFRALRNAVLGESGLVFDPRQPFQDYYYRPERLAQMRALISGHLDLPLSADEAPALREALAARMAYESPDLVRGIDLLDGTSFRDWFERSLELIAGRSPDRELDWVGFKEVWIIDFIPLLARAFPEARFLVLHRDPRAILHSLRGLAARDPSQAAHELSYLRHWRKYLAFDLWLSRQAEFADRVLSLRYEDLLVNAPEQAAKICAFLDLDDPESLLDTERYIDYASGGLWQGNSSFSAQLKGISPDRAESWRKGLDQDWQALCEFVCSHDMARLGYSSNPPALTAGVLDLLARTEPVSWRSDLGDLGSDVGFELLRNHLLTQDAGPTELIEGCFLFSEIFFELKS